MDTDAVMHAAAGETHGDTHVLRFVVPLPRPEGEVWPAVATREGLGAWLAAVDVLEPRLGGAVVVRWLDEPEAGSVSGTVTAWDVDRVAEYSLVGAAGRMRFHLEPGERGDPGATVLRFTHTFQGPEHLRRARLAIWPTRFHHLVTSL
ncbi:hypothetical protein [Streptomyces sp. TRM49041]|uniref:hypothetical protein n=1 Tax=Streptomyces sp. TRM49041 TaxID=2603216 RepID=UPI0021CCE3ED|nr:hypothetical protein [Streptomyces sp. TRM49041]